VTKSKTGYFFQRVTGREAASCENLMDVDRVVEAALQRALPVRTYRTDVIGEHGNVFPIVDSAVDLDRQIDAELSRMRWCVDGIQDR
jgi:hypothetical protein